MKKIILSVVAGFMLIHTVQAQVSIIPKAGITLASMASKNDEGQKGITGFVVGAGFNFPVDADGFFSLQPELLYIQKGAAASVNGTDYSLKINYLELPLLAKISFGGESVKAYVNAGPSIGYALSQKATVGSLSADADFDSESTNRTDFGLQFGGGVGFQAGPGSILLDLRYGFGLSNYSKGDSSTSSDDNKSQHRVIAISLGYAIPLGGK